MAFIEIVPPEDAEGTLKEVYDEAAGKRGSVANILQIHSLMPETMRSHLRLYMDIVYGKGPLSRLEREALAVVVSAANDCNYCVMHHSDALDRYMKDPEATRQVATDFESSNLTEKQKALCRFAVKLTKTPGAMSAGDAEELRSHGWGDDAILHTNLVAAYYNFVNRNALGLGVGLEEAEQAYKY